ncbi:MAG: M20 family metallo-hydrolase [Bacteroidaceae bacterium]|nr:M20 family metallo-hydrolase [Bacteroidaceae bacterium]
MDKYISLLDRLIETPSISRTEDKTASILASFLQEQGVRDVHRDMNNVWATCANFDEKKPTLLLNSHHDTVRPCASYTRDPFKATHEGGRIYGLGSNDAGASAVSLTATFCQLYEAELPFNLMLVLSAEEEVTGDNGIRHLLPLLPKIDMAIVGEPTCMRVALGERGLMVMDGIAHGVSGHAARNEGVNALYLAIDDINTLRNYQFDKESSLLGPIKVSVTQIQAGTQHNVVPDECRFVADVRTTDAYTNEETAALLQQAVKSQLTPRSTRIHASAISEDHPLVVAARRLGLETFVSPTTSDMSQMRCPSIKIGPGDSARSHSADEWVGIEEIRRGIETYVELIKGLKG